MPKTAQSSKREVRIETFSRIVRDKKVMHGQPVIKGTRIPVSLIFDYLANGYTAKDILERFPHLTPEDITEALHYGSSLIQG